MCCRDWQSGVFLFFFFLCQNWKPAANRDHCAASSVDVLHILEETLDAFFSFSLENPELLATLVNGLDKALQHYITQTVNPCGGHAFFPSHIMLCPHYTSNRLWFLRSLSSSLSSSVLDSNLPVCFLRLFQEPKICMFHHCQNSLGAVSTSHG